MSGEPEEVPAEQAPPQKTAEQLQEEQKLRQEQERAKEEQRKKQEQENRIKREQDMKKLEEALKGCVSGICKSADNTSMINGKLTLAEKEIERLFPSILKFSEVLHADLSTNMLSDVSILGEFPNLITLNLSKNQIPNLSVFATDKKLTKLQFLNVSGNKIKELTQIALPSLRKLNLNENQITGVKQFKGHNNLTILELRKNKLRKLKGLSNMKNLKELYVCENEITDIRGLQNLNALVKLSARNNKIKTVMAPFPYLPALKHLNLRENQITSLKELLKFDDHITSINILANPVTDELGENLKKEIYWQLPHVIKINKSAITQQEKIGFQKERLQKLAQEEKQRLEKELEGKKEGEQPQE